MYDLLQSEMNIGRLRLPNRAVMPAMGVNLGSPQGGVSDGLIAFYEARAAGGVAGAGTQQTGQQQENQGRRKHMEEIEPLVAVGAGHGASLG